MASLQNGKTDAPIIAHRWARALACALVAEIHDWLQVTLDANSRHGLAEAIEKVSDSQHPERDRLLRILRSSRDELLFDKAQGELVLEALNVDRRLSALRARLEAFLGLR